MKLKLLLVFGCALAAVHALAHPLLNDREAESFVLGRFTRQHLEQLSVTPESVLPMFKGVLEGLRGEACAFALNDALFAKLSEFPQFNGDRELFLKAVRYAGVIDDVVLRLLLQAHWVQKDVSRRAAEDWSNPTEAVDPRLAPVLEFSRKRARGKCLHENFRELLSAYRSGDKNFSVDELRPRLEDARRAKLLSARALSELTEALRDGIQTWQISLADYVSKKNFLRVQFPLERPLERSEFVTTQAGKEKFSHRQRLFLSYSPLQITLMGDVVKKLKLRLESPRIEILVFDREDELLETFSLEPMERFRFAVRVLRKEMRLLSTNTYFAGRQPSYTDLMAAAYEKGVITAEELDEVARLEEIWNPRKTLWEKAGVWVRLFTGVATVVVPPPYGFLPALAIVVIEGALQAPANDDQDSLF